MSSQGSVTWNTLPNYLPGVGINKEENEGTFFWVAGGHGSDSSPISYALTPTSGLLGDIENGGFVSIFGTPADTEVGYLSNTPRQGNPAPAYRDRCGCPGAGISGAHSDRAGNHGTGQAVPGQRENALA